jgi:hypothetical protein
MFVCQKLFLFYKWNRTVINIKNAYKIDERCKSSIHTGIFLDEQLCQSGATCQSVDCCLGSKYYKHETRRACLVYKTDIIIISSRWFIGLCLAEKPQIQIL